MDSFEPNITPPPVAVCPPNEIITVVPPSHPDHFGPHRPKHKAMNPHDFENLYKKVKNKAFKDDQMELLSVGVVNHRFYPAPQAASALCIYNLLGYANIAAIYKHNKILALYADFAGH